MGSAHGHLEGCEGELKNLTYLDLIGLRGEKTRSDYERILVEFFLVNGFSSEDDALAKLRNGGADDALLRFIAHLRKPRPGKPRGLSPKSIHLYVGVIRGWLDFHEIPYNRIKLRRALPRKRVEKEVKALSKNIIKTIIQLMHPSKKLACWVMFACGLRISEMVNLRVRDLDLNANPPRLYVRESKTPAGRRVVFIPGDLAEKLREWVKGRRPDWPLFPSESDPSKPMHHNRFRIAFYGALRRLGLLEKDSSGRGYAYHPHSLRRSFETVLKNAGINRDVLAKLMGHEMGVEESYYKPTEEELAREWLKFEKYLRLDVEEPSLDEMQARKRLEELAEKYARRATLKALTEVWNIFMPNQPVDEFFMLEGIPPEDDEEKIKALRSALNTLITLKRAELRKALLEAAKEEKRK